MRARFRVEVREFELMLKNFYGIFESNFSFPVSLLITRDINPWAGVLMMDPLGGCSVGGPGVISGLWPWSYHICKS